MILRLAFGLGASTALSDAIPWGLWKILNMVAGVALATGGFTLACAVYVFGLKKYRPILRPAILVAFLGYGSSCFALMLDIGLPHRIWHAIVYWNEHSFLFEVAWCVMLYFTVTIIEMAPIILERFPYPRLLRWLHRGTKPVVIIGITLSTLHHSSLGSLFLVTPSRLHEIWYTSWLPILFFVSAAGGGMMFVVLVTIAYGWLTERRPDYAVLRGIASAAAIVLAALFVLKLLDVNRRDLWLSVLSGSPESVLFGAELLIGCVIPVFLIAASATRKTPVGLVTASASAAGGLVLNRLNVGIFGYFRTAEVFYVPTLPEWALSIGIVAAAGLAFLYVSEHFAIFDHLLEPAGIGPGQLPFDGGLLRPMWQSLRQHRLSHVTLLPVFVIPLAIIVFWNDAVEGYPLRRMPVVPPTAADGTRSVLRIDGDADGDFVAFDHARHQKDLGQADSCQRCHHVYLPGDQQTPCHRCHGDMVRESDIFDHELHALWVGHRKANGLPRELRGDTIAQVGQVLQRRRLECSGPGRARLQNLSCTQCHQEGGRPKSADTAVACGVCHGRDMGLSEEKRISLVQWAPSYMDAMHQQCIACHQREAKQQDRPQLAECEACHWPTKHLVVSTSEMPASP
jgi:Ni/Fe-hydrogenase subunit HybB-like protein